MSDQSDQINGGDRTEGATNRQWPCWLVMGVSLALIMATIFYSVRQFQQSQPVMPESLSFAAYPQIHTAYVAQIPDYEIKVDDLNNLAVFQDRDSVSPASDFSAENLTKLTQVHSWTAPENHVFYQVGSENLDEDSANYRTDDWVELYQRYAGPTHPCLRRLDGSVFISTDYLMHLYHRLLERQMEYLDQEEFTPRLTKMLTLMLDRALIAQQQSKVENQTSWDRVTAYLGVGLALLNNDPQAEKVVEVGFEETAVEAVDTLENSLQILAQLGLSDRAQAWAQAELTKIYAANQIESSTIFADLSIDRATFDYTQFQPRSYYNKNATLRSYFRSMMWLGRVNFNLSSPELTRDAINLTKVMADPEIEQLWRDIYEPTAFLVGTSDDLNFADYEAVLGKNKLSDQTKTTQVQQVMAAREQFRQPQMLSEIVIDESVLGKTDEELVAESLSWRLMGQRITPDGYIFEQLIQGETQPDPVTGQSLPSTATSTMVMAALGSQTAENYLQSWATISFPDSTEVLKNKVAQLKTEFDQKTTAEWTQNSYWSWLYLYRSLINEQQDWTGYPRFMSFENWRTKDLNAALGSWTELKHDTLLYAKQQYAEMGAGGDECEIQPVPKGYVEPNIEFLDRLEAMTVMTKNELESRGILHQEIGYRSDIFLEQLRFYRELAVKQLANEVISDEEFEELQRSSLILSQLPAVLPGQVQSEREARSALIADVQTDAVTGQVVYEATGIPQALYVAVSDANGTRLTKGLAFAQYEFTAPLGERLTDEQWWTVVYGEDQNQLPALSPWSADI